MKTNIKTGLRTLWESRSPHDRKIISVFTATVLILFYVLFVQAAGKSRTALRANVMTLRTQAVSLDQQAIEYNQLRSTPAISVSPTDVQALVQTRVNETGLAPSLQRIDVLDSNRVVVTFAAISFVDWLHWVVDLKAQHIRVATCRIEALSTPGLVNVTVTLLRQSNTHP